MYLVNKDYYITRLTNHRDLLHSMIQQITGSLVFIFIKNLHFLLQSVSWTAHPKYNAHSVATSNDFVAKIFLNCNCQCACASDLAFGLSTFPLPDLTAISAKFEFDWICLQRYLTNNTGRKQQSPLHMRRVIDFRRNVFLVYMLFLWRRKTVSFYPVVFNFLVVCIWRMS